MDEFKLRKVAVIQRVISMFYPLTPLVAIIYLVVSDTIRFEDKIPLLTLGLLSWLGYELFRLYQRVIFKISIGDDGIQIKGKAAAWSEIVKAELNGLRFGMDPAIILHLHNGNKMKIPAVIEGLPFITSLVEKHVSHVKREGE